MRNEITMTCQPFTFFAKGVYKLSVDTDGTVRVYDRTAGHYTTCHSLSERSMAAARRKAAN